MTQSKREIGWAAVGNRTGARAAYKKWLKQNIEQPNFTMTMSELVLARDYAAYVEDDQELVREINKTIGAEMRRVCGVE